MLSRRSVLKLLPALPLLSSFRLKQVKPTLRFIVASDGHYGQPNTPFEENHKNIVAWLNQEKTQKGLDFVVFNGDLIHDDPTLLYDFKNSINSLQVPYYVTRGNHDQVALDVWRSTFGYNTNHSFERGNYGFILLDTSNEKGEYICPDINWLTNELGRFATKKGIFVFMHITPAKWTKHGIDCEEIRTLFTKHKNVKAIFSGHDHNEDSFKTLDGMPYFFDGHFGGSWGTAYKGYRVVEVLPDETWKSYQFNASADPVLNSFSGK